MYMEVYVVGCRKYFPVMYITGWIRLVFAHLFPFNTGAPITSANFISDDKVHTLMIELAQLMGAPLFKTNRLAQSSPFPVRPFRMED